MAFWKHRGGAASGPYLQDRPQGNRVCPLAHFSLHTQSIAQLWRATKHRSQAWTSSTILTPEEDIQAVPTSINDSLPQNTFRIVLERALLSLKELQIIPGIIDPNHQGEFQILENITGGHVFIQHNRPLPNCCPFPGSLLKISTIKPPGHRAT